MDDTFINLAGCPVIKPEDRFAKDRISVYGILIDNNKILLVRSKGVAVWDLPGGGQENGEDDIATLKREMLEEANCEVLKIGECIKKTQINFYADDIDEYYYNTGKLYRIVEWKFVEKKLEKEIEEFKMVDLKDLNRKNIRPYLIEIIKELKQ